MQSITLEYAADGLPMKSDLYLPDAAGKRPGVLVFPEAFGIGEHVRTRARRLAEQGYVALACDLHGNAHRYDRIEEVMGLIGPLRGEVARIRARAAVGFHSGLATVAPDDAKHIRARVLVCIGADDPAISAEERLAFEQEMRAGGANWQMHLYGGVVHSFTNEKAAALGQPGFARYDADADARSWRAMRELFAEVLDPRA